MLLTSEVGSILKMCWQLFSESKADSLACSFVIGAVMILLIVYCSISTWGRIVWIRLDDDLYSMFVSVWASISKCSSVFRIYDINASDPIYAVST